jgi:hypothetical protein
MKYITFFLLIPSALMAALTQDQLAEVDSLYNSAISMIESGDKSKRNEILTQLKEAQGILMQDENLPENLEEQLTKINSHIYWQIKFSTTEDLKMQTEKKKKANKEKKKKETLGDNFKKESYARWLKEKKERQKQFKSVSQHAMTYEKRHGNDHQSNLLNFLDLQLKVVDHETGAEMLNKARYYQEKINHEKQKLLDPVLDSISNYKSLLSAKDFDKLFMELARKLKYGNYDNKTKKAVKQYAIEIQALSKMKTRLVNSLSPKSSIAVPPTLLNDFDGVVSKANSEGVEVLSNAGQKSTIGWGVVSEEAICSMSLNFMDSKNSDDLFILVVSNLRMKRYEIAFEYLNELMKLDSKNYLRYRDFLAQCETGYRLKYGELFEKAFLRVEELSASGQAQQAFQIMDELMNTYMNSPLGQSYVERFNFIYDGILRA